MLKNVAIIALFLASLFIMGGVMEMPGEAIFQVYMISLPFAVICALAAPSRNRDAWDWFWIGFLASGFGLLAILVMGKAEPDAEAAKP